MSRKLSKLVYKVLPLSLGIILAQGVYAEHEASIQGLVSSNNQIAAILDVGKQVLNTASAAIGAGVQTTAEGLGSVGNHVGTELNPGLLYNELHQLAPGLDPKALQCAIHAYDEAEAEHLVKNPKLTVIDYSLPSSQQRMWVFNVLNTPQLLLKTYVAHGKNSGATFANHFSNIADSKSSSLGTFITQNIYSGHNGISLVLQGLEAGYNDNASNRHVVIHGAWYMDPGYIQQAGHAGRSWGCPAVAKAIAPQLINTIKGGSVVFAYYPDSSYLSHSHYA